ncbi:M48 family metallopeptidase [Coralloluteibacterium stylophorae]|uniref:M48 family metallopeptidase n=1 Tax=Coralloluteibacterium stylophorae TaxID=1776034 RepID=A0A8J8AXM5_9GAMM|nr:M48 family metallopeptidase [Coralloluteibacterium stylophorae]MBS7458954.1 M48 family metallopeptidase [Coralloluteibacterium stylophorae]
MKRLPALLAAAVLAACATSPTGRSQLRLFSGTEMNQMGIAAFDEMKQKDALARNPRQSAYVQCVVDALVQELPAGMQQLPWEAQVFADEEPNAFALPGGKVGVNTGMFAVARTQDQLAAVIGHEIGHVMAQHANERVSHTTLAQTGLTAVQAYAGSQGASPQGTQALMAALGAGAQVGYLLPFSRVQESEADVIGQQMMARAGFDPRAAADLWQNMIAASGEGQRAPQLLSTHPDPRNRIDELEARAPALAPDFQQARASGRAPRCG